MSTASPSSKQGISLAELRQLQFRRAVRVLPNRKAASLRDEFVRTFLRTNTEFFKNNIQRKRRCFDGLCYSGYIWDCVGRYSRISLKTLLRRLLKYEKVYVFWDVHSRDKILIRDCWLFPKHAVLEMTAETLTANFVFLPEDIYIFDSTLSWALIKTHEYDQNGDDIFLAARPTSPGDGKTKSR